MSDYRYFPNRVSAASSTSNTDWQLLASDGTGHASYVALQAAGKTLLPGNVAPQGVPRLVIQSVNAAGTGAGGTVQVVTNTLIAPTTAQALAIGTLPPTVIEDGMTTSVWIKKTTGADAPLITGYF